MAGYGIRGAWRRLAANWRLARRPDVPAALPFPWRKALAILAGGVAMVVAVALLVDARLMAALENQPHHVTAFFEIITHVGKSDWVLIPTAILVVVIAFADWSRVSRRHAAAWAEIAAFAATAFLIVAASGLFTDVLKPIFGRMRPPYAEGGVLDFAPLTFGGYRNYSFPSGHSTVSGALLALIAAGPRTGWRMPAMLFVIAVACSRAMINVHYPSDVVAGLIVGAGGGWLILHRMARGGFGFVFGPNGSIGWRFGIINRMRARGGWVSSLMPPLWVALAPARLLVRRGATTPLQAAAERRANRLRVPIRGEEAVHGAASRIEGSAEGP